MSDLNEINDLKFDQNKNECLIDTNNSEDEMTEIEKKKCKENGFILIGKTGVGKTALLNVIFGKEKGKVGHSSKSETKESNYYCIKYKFNNKIIYFSIIDTPGLFDTEGFDADINQKKDIKNLICKEKIKIKGLFFLANFQNERFDASEQTSLVEYNALFPMKEFWNRIVFIFTHYYGDPDGDSKEEIQVRSQDCLTQIINNIMEKVKKVSSTIDFKEIKKEYVNLYSKVKNDKQLKNNDLIKKDLISIISEYIKLKPMFSQLQIFHFEKFNIELNDKYLYDCDLTLYLDADNNPIYKDFDILKKYQKIDDNIKGQKIIFNSQKCKIDEKGNLIIINSKKDGIKEIFKDSKSKIGGVVTVCSLIGLIFSGIFFHPTIPVCILTLLGGAVFIKKSSDEQEKIENDKIMEIMETQNIKKEVKDLIQNYSSKIIIDEDID